jgi:hypothetical protein
MESPQCLLDEHIREALRKVLRMKDSSAAIIDEMPLMRGRGRADLAFVNGRLCGYEIKSGADSLGRLDVQRVNYESVFEFNTIVVAHKHLETATRKLPLNWGIIEVAQKNGRTELLQRRRATRNHNVDRSALARLLWKSECQRILRKVGIKVRPYTPVIDLWPVLEALNTRHLCSEVREALKRREAKVAGQHIPYDGSHTTVAIE